MTAWEEFFADQIMDSQIRDVWGDDPMVYAALSEDEAFYSTLQDKFRTANRESDEYETDEDADLATEAALSPYREARTVQQALDTVPRAPELETDSAFGFAIDKFQKTLGHGVSTLGDLFGSDSLRGFGDRVVQQQLRDIEEGGYQSKYNKSFTETMDEGGVFSAIGWLGEKMAENWADIGFSLVGGGAGLLVKGALRAGVGAATLSGTSVAGIGGVREELEEKGVYDKDDAALATGVGVLIGIIDKVTGGNIAGSGQAIKQLVENGTAKAVGQSVVNTAAGFGKEGLTEAAQEAAIIGTAMFEGAEYEPSAVVNRLIDSAMIGGAFGAAGASASDVGFRLFSGDKKDVDESVDGVPVDEIVDDIVVGDDTPDVDTDLDEDVADQGIVDDATKDDAVDQEGDVEDDIAQEQRPNVAEAEQDQDLLKVLAAETQKQTADIDIERTKEQAQRLKGTTHSDQHKNTVLSDYGEQLNDPETYEDLEKQTVQAAKEQIESLLSDAGIEVEVGDVAQTASGLRSDVLGRKVVTVAKGSRAGLLGDIVPGKDYTYGEALQGIREAYGRVGAGSQMDDLGDRLADINTVGLFNPKAQPVIISEVSNPGTQFLVPKVVAQAERVQIDHNATLRFAGRPESENPGRLDELSDAIGRGESVVEAGVLGRAAQRVGQALKRERSETDLREPRFANAMYKYGLGPIDTELRHYGRVQKGEQERAQADSLRMEYGFGRMIKKMAKRTGEDRKALEESINTLFNHILDGEAEVLTADRGATPTRETVLRNQDGEALVLYKDGTKRYVPDEMIDLVLEMNALVRADQGAYLGEIDKQAAHLQKKLEAQEEKINQLALDSQRDGEDTMSIDYALWDSSETVRERWLQHIGDGRDKKRASHLDDLMETIFVEIAEGNVDAQDVTALEAEKTRIRSLFYDAVVKSKDITDFLERTGGEFVDENGQFNYITVAALGGFDKAKHRDEAMRELAAEHKTYTILQRKLDHISNIANNPHYMSRVFEAFTEPTGRWVKGMENPKTKDQRKRWNDLHSELMTESYEAQEKAAERAGEEFIFDEDAADAHARQRMVEMIEKARSHVERPSVLGDAPPSALKKRKDLSDAERAFYGEITDPARRMAATINRVKAARLHAAKTNYLWETYGGRGMYKTREEIVAAGEDPRLYEETEMPDPYADSPKQKAYVTKEMKGALDVFQSLERSNNKWVRGMLQYNAMFRMFHTVYKYPLAVMNAHSTMSSMIQAGAPEAWFMKDGDAGVHRSIKAVAQGLTGREITDPAMKDAFEAVIGGEVQYEEILSHARLAQDPVGKGLRWLADATDVEIAGMEARQVADLMEKGWNGYVTVGKTLYRGGDLVQKLVTYQAIKARLDKSFGESLSPDKISQMARDYTIETGFDSSEVPKFVDYIREKTPLGGGFLSFNYLTYSVTYKNLKWIRRFRLLEAAQYGRENVDGFDETNPDHMQEALRAIRFQPQHTGLSTKQSAFAAGALMYHGALGAMLASLARGIFGDDDEEFGVDTDAMRALVSDWYKNSSFAIVGADERDNIKWVDVSRMSNHGLFAEGFNALFTDDPTVTTVQAAKNAMSAMLGGYWTEAFGVSAGTQLLNNRTKFGQQIYNDEEGAIANAIDMGGWIAKELGGATTAWSAVSGVASLFAEEDYNKITGKERSFGEGMLEYAGLRVKTFDPQHELGSRIWSEYHRMRASKDYMRNKLRSYNELSDAEITTVVRQNYAIQQDIYRSVMHKIDAARRLGLTDAEISDSMKKKFNKDVRRALLNGIIPPPSIGKLGIESTKSAQRKQVEQAAKDNFAGNYKRAIDIFNNL